MKTDYSSKAENWVRRKDRRVEDSEWIESFLHHAAWGTLATQTDQTPFINSNLFVYHAERKAIYMHTAHEGRTRNNVSRYKQVCFSISEMGRLLPAPFARNFSVEYKGVTVFGEISIVEDAEEGRDALQKILDKYFPHLTPETDYRPIQLHEIEATTVFRIDIQSWSGKMKQVEAEFPGACVYASQD